MAAIENQASSAFERLLRAEPSLADIAARQYMLEDETIGSAGLACTHLYVIEKGLVALRSSGELGDDRLLALLGPGDLFGEEALSDGYWLTTAYALTPVRAWMIPGRCLPQVFRYCPAANQYVLVALTRRLESAHRLISVLGRHSARARVHALLCLISGVSETTPTPDLPVPSLTQHQMGAILGMARETVARALRDLEETGAIRRRGRLTWLRQGATIFALFTIVMVRGLIAPTLYYVPEDDTPQPRGRRGRVQKAPTKAVTTIGASAVKP